MGNCPTIYVERGIMEIIIISGAPQTEFTARCCISIEKGAIGDKDCPKLSRKVWFGQKSCKKANNVTNWNRRDRKGIFQMKDIKEIVTRLSGHRNRACYPVLCMSLIHIFLRGKGALAPDLPLLEGFPIDWIAQAR